jgi:RES domain-containing protein
LVHVWRIVRKPHATLDGEGARLYGGRWNSEGNAVVYTSQYLSLATLEYLANVEPALMPDDLVALRIEIPDDPQSGAEVDTADFTDPHWRDYPSPGWQAELGDLWVDDGEFLWLAVPSAVVPEEYNILINPKHPRMSEVRVVETQPFKFDKRLV